MSAPVQIRRDPFARASLMRAVAHHRYRGAGTVQSCSWCGTTDKTLYAYWWEGDGSVNRLQSGHAFGKSFCSVSCYEAYAS